jgi:hypothetical protein
LLFVGQLQSEEGHAVRHRAGISYLEEIEPLEQSLALL